MGRNARWRKAAKEERRLARRGAHPRNCPCVGCVQSGKHHNLILPKDAIWRFRKEVSPDAPRQD
jgi:hypothetical protein